MHRFGMLAFQSLCVLLYVALAIYVASTYGWVMLLIFVVQFVLLLAIQTQVTSQRNTIEKLKFDIARLIEKQSATLN